MGRGAELPRIYRFGNAEFDEARSELRVGGSVCSIESKPLAVLHELLRHDGKVVSKDALKLVV